MPYREGVVREFMLLFNVLYALTEQRVVRKFMRENADYMRENAVTLNWSNI